MRTHFVGLNRERGHGLSTFWSFPLSALLSAYGYILGQSWAAAWHRKRFFGFFTLGFLWFGSRRFLLRSSEAAIREAQISGRWSCKARLTGAIHGVRLLRIRRSQFRILYSPGSPRRRWWKSTGCCLARVLRSLDGVLFRRVCNPLLRSERSAECPALRERTPGRVGREFLSPLRPARNAHLMLELTQLRDFAKRYTAAWNSQNAASVAAFFAPSGLLSVNGVPAVGVLPLPWWRRDS